MPLLSVVLVIVTLFFSPLPASSQEPMTITLPEEVLAQAISATLPLAYAAHSKTLQGKLEIIELSELQLLDQQIGGRLHLAGKDLKVVTELAGHAINFNVGAVELDFHTVASLRFDAARQILFVKPMVDKVHTSKDGGGGDIGVAIIGLFDDRELPIHLDNLDPFIAHAGDKRLSISSKIADIRSSPRQLHITVFPQIAASAR